MNSCSVGSGFAAITCSKAPFDTLKRVVSRPPVMLSNTGTNDDGSLLIAKLFRLVAVAKKLAGTLSRLLTLWRIPCVKRRS